MFARRMGKQIENIPAPTMSAVSSYHWPGNIRELQNLIERAVILSNDGVLPNPLPATATHRVRPAPSAATTLKESERALILRTLEWVSWVIGGPSAAKLGWRLEGPQERHQILLLLLLQFRAENQVEELNRILQRQQTLVVHIGRVILNAAQRKGFDRPVPDRHHVVDHYRLEEALRLKVVHQVVGVKRRLVAARALALAEEDLLAAHLGGRRFAGNELAKNVKLGRRWKVQHLLEIGHEVHLTSALERIHTFLRGDHSIAVEIRRALLEFGEILDRLQSTLRTEEPLNVHAAERQRLDAVAELLRARIGGEVRRAVLVAVRMAIKASRAKAGNLRAAILGRVELLLRKGRQQQAQSFQLPRSEKAIEQLVIIGERDQLALRDIAQIGARGQVEIGR